MDAGPTLCWLPWTLTVWPPSPSQPIPTPLIIREKWDFFADVAPPGEQKQSRFARAPKGVHVLANSKKITNKYHLLCSFMSLFDLECPLCTSNHCENASFLTYFDSAVMLFKQQLEFNLFKIIDALSRKKINVAHRRYIFSTEPVTHSPQFEPPIIIIPYHTTSKITMQLYREICKTALLHVE